MKKAEINNYAFILTTIPFKIIYIDLIAPICIFKDLIPLPGGKCGNTLQVLKSYLSLVIIRWTF